MARKNYIPVRLSDSERSLFESLANKEGIPLADWMREAGKIYAALIAERSMETGKEENNYHRQNSRGSRLLARDATIDQVEDGKVFVTHPNLDKGCVWVDRFKGVFNLRSGDKLDIYYVWSNTCAYFLATRPNDPI